MQSNWQSSFFRGVANEMWRRAVSPEQTRAEVDFLERTFAGSPQARFLDVPCGNGRHAIEFAKRGYQMTGVDQSEEFIADGRASNADARWVTGDMCDLPWNSEFDGAYCFGNSFGYLDRSGATRFFNSVARALKPESRFVIETGMAAESILPTLVRNRWFKLGDLFMLSENQYSAKESRLDIQYTFIQDGKVDTRPSSSYVMTVAEICSLLSSAGFEVADLFRSAAGEPYELGSPRLILVARAK